MLPSRLSLKGVGFFFFSCANSCKTHQSTRWSSSKSYFSGAARSRAVLISFLPSSSFNQKNKAKNNDSLFL